MARAGDVPQVVQISGVCSSAMRSEPTPISAHQRTGCRTRSASCVSSLACGNGVLVGSIGQRGFQSGDAGCAGTGGTPAIVGRARLDRAPRVRVRPRVEAAYSWPVEARYFLKFRQWLYSVVDADQPSGPRPGAKWRCWVGWLPTDQRGSARR